MAPTSYSYSRVPTDEFPKKLGDCKLPVWVGILLRLLVVGLSVAVGVLAAKFNSPACKDCLPAEQVCRNITHLLEHELTQAQEVLRGTEAQAATCNQTVETLKISLKKKTGGLEQQELVQKLQEEIKTLNQSLQNQSSELQKKSAELQRKSAELQEKSAELQQKSAELQEKSSDLWQKSAELWQKSAELREKSAELEQGRKENEALVSAKGPPDSGICLSLSGAAVLLFLLALLACCPWKRACRHIFT